jgi:hypothetical protein
MQHSTPKGSIQHTIIIPFLAITYKNISIY